MFLEQQISILDDFWRSCDTEDWSNDAENSALHHRNKLHFKLNCNNVSQNYWFYCIINQINVALVGIKII